MDPGFPRRGRQLQSGALICNLAKTLLDNCMEMKEIGLSPRPFGSANGMESRFVLREDCSGNSIKSLVI